jgi:hypothetical protein
MSTAIILGPPPEFSSDGTPPPVFSDPMIVATWGFSIDTASSELSDVKPARVNYWPRTGTVGAVALLSPVLVPAAAAAVGAKLLARRGSQRAAPVRESVKSTAEREPRQLVYSQRWRRDDPIVQLPPGVTSEKSYTVTTGIEHSRTREISQSLGMNTASPVEFSASLGSKFGLQLTIKSEETETSTLKLANDASDCYRLFARWSVVHRLEVVTAEDPLRALATAEIVDADSVNLTSADVPRRA